MPYSETTIPSLCCCNRTVPGWYGRAASIQAFGFNFNYVMPDKGYSQAVWYHEMPLPDYEDTDRIYKNATVTETLTGDTRYHPESQSITGAFSFNQQTGESVGGMSGALEWDWIPPEYGYTDTVLISSESRFKFRRSYGWQGVVYECDIVFSNPVTKFDLYNQAVSQVSGMEWSRGADDWLENVQLCTVEWRRREFSMSVEQSKYIGRKNKVCVRRVENRATVEYLEFLKNQETQEIVFPILPLPTPVYFPFETFKAAEHLFTTTAESGYPNVIACPP